MKPKRPEPVLEKLTKYVKVGMVPTGAKPWDTRQPQTVPESWSPNYPGDKVLVSFTEADCPSGAPTKWHVSVWGADDTGVEFWTGNRAEALWRYESIGDGVTQDALTAVGFVYC